MWFKRKLPKPVDEIDASVQNLSSGEKRVLVLIQQVFEGRSTAITFTRVADDVVAVLELDPNRSDNGAKSVQINLSSLGQKHTSGELADERIKQDMIFMTDRENKSQSP